MADAVAMPRADMLPVDDTPDTALAATTSLPPLSPVDRTLLDALAVPCPKSAATPLDEAPDTADTADTPVALLEPEDDAPLVADAETVDMAPKTPDVTVDEEWDTDVEPV